VGSVIVELQGLHAGNAVHRLSYSRAMSYMGATRHSCISALASVDCGHAHMFLAPAKPHF
jgi:hypothetical protein